MAPNLPQSSNSSNLQSHPSVQHLQTTDTNQAEQITGLRIRVAVLENELAHARQDKDAVSNSLGIVIESLTRFHNSNSNSNSHICHLPNHDGDGGAVSMAAGGAERGDQVRGLEKEVERLRKENKGLRRQVRGQAPNFLSRFSNGDEGEFAVRELGRFRAGTPVQTSASVSIDKVKGKGKERDRTRESFEHKNNVENLIELRTGLEAEQFIGSWGKPLPSDSETRNSNMNQSFESGSTTVPNTPLLAPNTNAAEFNASFADVGLHSLEENMEMDEFPPSISAEVSFNEKGNVEGGNGEEGDIDRQIAEQQMAMQKFNNVPKPRVLKVGFEGEGKRGEEYDYASLSSSSAPSCPRNRSMRDYDRFGPPTGPREMSFGGHSSFEIPKDRSFDSTLWKEKEERNGAVDIHVGACSGRDTRFPNFFRYGIQYVPAESDTNYLRTVHISNLPLDTTLRDVLARVRGGEIQIATLLDTISITGSLSARIVFRHEAAAEEYTLYVSSYPLFFGEDDTKAEVTLLTTPTYPLNARASNRVNAHAQTRCLCLPNFPPTFSLNALERDLACGNGYRAEALVEMWIDESGTLHLQFSSVEMAGSAFGILSAWQSYRGLEVRFEADSCADPVEELALPVKPRPLMLPGSWVALREGEKLRKGVGGELIDEQRKTSAALNGSSVGGELIETQRKRPAALSNQKVEIPSFSGRAIEGPSWADEVIKEAESGPLPALSSPVCFTVPPNSPTHHPAMLTNCTEQRDQEQSIDEKINTIMVGNINEIMFQSDSKWWTDSGHKPPVGLAGSEYASLALTFEDVAVLPRFQSSASPCSKSAPTVCVPGDESPDSSTGSTSSSPKTNPSTIEERNPDEGANSNSSAASSPTRLTTQEIALHRLALLDSQAPIPLPFLSDNNLRLRNSPPRVGLQDLLASSESEDEIEDGSERVSPLTGEQRDWNVDGEERVHEQGKGKVAGCGERQSLPAPSTNEQQQINPDEISVDDEHEIELCGRENHLQGLDCCKEQSEPKLEKLIRGEMIHA